jgi:hypothetical protein
MSGLFPIAQVQLHSRVLSIASTMARLKAWWLLRESGVKPPHSK